MLHARRTSTLTRLTMTAASTVAGLALVAGPAFAQGGSPSTDNPGMQRMHELRQQGNPGMQRMHELMQQGNPGMQRMHEAMMNGTR